jgi:hypothetical protein
VFFQTRATLLPEDTDKGGLDSYVARVGGGFPQTEAVASCSSEQECRGSAATGSGDAGATSPGSASFVGPDNRVEPPKAPKRGCGKGKVRRQGRCVKKPKRHRHHGKAGANRRAGR